MAADQRSPHREALARVACRDVGAVMFDEPLSRHCSWRIGGPADLLVEPENVDQAALLVRSVAEAGVPLVVIGSGSNLLFSDDGVRGVVLKLGPRMARFSANGNHLVAEAGIWMPRFARKAGEAGVSGFEHTAGIPGTLGGLVLMNGGSQRKCIGTNVIRIWGITGSGDQLCLERESCDFSYRHCRFPDDGFIITKVELAGESREPRAIRREMLEILRSRRMKFPLKQPNCGSVFLSTSELHAALGPPGKIIEEAGLKGACVGEAQVSPKHANFIVNRGNARACEVLSLIRTVRKEVQAKYGVDLCCEVRYVNSEGTALPADRVCDIQEGQDTA